MICLFVELFNKTLSDSLDNVFALNGSFLDQIRRGYTGIHCIPNLGAFLSFSAIQLILCGFSLCRSNTNLGNSFLRLRLIRIFHCQFLPAVSTKLRNLLATNAIKAYPTIRNSSIQRETVATAAIAARVGSG